MVLAMVLGPPIYETMRPTHNLQKQPAYSLHITYISSKDCWDHQSSQVGALEDFYYHDWEGSVRGPSSQELEGDLPSGYD